MASRLGCCAVGGDRASRLSWPALALASLLAGASARAQEAPAPLPVEEAASPGQTPGAEPKASSEAASSSNDAATAPEPSTQASAEQGATSGAAWDYLDQAGSQTTAPGNVDLAALGIVPEEAGESYPKFSIYGFADFTFWYPMWGKDNAWRFYLPSHSTFWVGNINLYVASEMSKVLRSLLEVRFTYLPMGKNRSAVELQGQPYVDSSAADYTEAERPMKLGAIEIERIQMEYAPLSWLSFVAGQWLTPYGIWNVDHGTPTTIAVHKPYIVGEQFLPERQTGLLIQGSFRYGPHRVGYNLGVSNGRGPLDAYYDMDNNKAVTGHLSWQADSSFGTLTLGASAYVGRYTNAQRKLGLAAGKRGGLELSTSDIVKDQYDEYSLAADAKYVKGGFQAFAEAASNVRKYTDSGRPALQGSLLQLFDPKPFLRVQPDMRRWGAYLIIGYRFGWLGIMPFAQVEYTHLDVPDMPALSSATGGLNIRPHESVTLKTQYGYGFFPGADQRGPARDGIQNFETQAAWAF